MPEADVKIVGISGFTHNYPELIAKALTRQGFSCSTSSIPFLPVENFTPSVLRRLKKELRESRSANVTVYCSGSAEHYVSGPHISVHFSAYRSWFNPQRMHVIAHPWTEAEPSSIEGVNWTNKPPLTVGFMGTAYGDSRVGRMISKSAAKRWILSGHHLRAPSLLATLNAAHFPLRHAMTFPRAETLRAAEAYAASAGTDLRIVDTRGFTGSEEQISQYKQQMHDLTYVLCPRGIENYSYRFYEALKFGRVPVLVDTDIVLPEGVNWDELIVRVPYAELSRIGSFITHDYETHSKSSFIRRQERALEVMANLGAGGWVEALANDVRRQLSKSWSRSSATEQGFAI